MFLLQSQPKLASDSRSALFLPQALQRVTTGSLASITSRTNATSSRLFSSRCLLIRPTDQRTDANRGSLGRSFGRLRQAFQKQARHVLIPHLVVADDVIEFVVRLDTASRALC